MAGDTTIGRCSGPAAEPARPKTIRRRRAAAAFWEGVRRRGRGGCRGGVIGASARPAGAAIGNGATRDARHPPRADSRSRTTGMPGSKGSCCLATTRLTPAAQANYPAALGGWAGAGATGRQGRRPQRHLRLYRQRRRQRRGRCTTAERSAGPARRVGLAFTSQTTAVTGNNTSGTASRGERQHRSGAVAVYGEIPSALPVALGGGAGRQQRHRRQRLRGLRIARTDRAGASTGPRPRGRRRRVRRQRARA